MANPTADTLISAGLSKSMAYHVASGTRTISLPLAMWLFEQDGVKVGPLESRTPRDIRMLREIHEPRAPQSVIRRRAARK